MSIGQTVRAFYENYPFNGYSEARLAAANITELNQIEATYADLAQLLKNRTEVRVADCGCGPGWFSSSIGYHYPNTTVVGYDFNPKALELAVSTKDYLKLKNVSFNELDLFEAIKCREKFDIVASIGVLHHTSDCRRALKAISSLLLEEPASRLYIGLYHRYGRKPFLDLFEEFKRKGYSEEALFQEYRKLHSSLSDETHLYSWFRDQVLHPHETQHSLEEVNDWLNDMGFEIVSTSINRFGAINKIEDLFVEERKLEKFSYQRNRIDKRYFPGFFTVCARRTKVE